MRLSPKPLPTNDLYILLSLARGATYGYQIIGMAYSFSRSGVILQPSSVYTRLNVLEKLKYITRVDPGVSKHVVSAPSSSRDRIEYRLTAIGIVRLQGEYHRFKHAIRVMDYARLGSESPPTDVDLLMAGIADKA